ncbi:hypothetical protein EPO34_03865 [Patescibacteria group bacterium]|nr:MAG: hypothetical protein EPO34_03865 [Patescibacteria group bacterium]
MDLLERKDHPLCRLMQGVVAVALVITGGIASTWVMFEALSVFAVSPPNIISYQGRLLNANGVPDASASRDFQFRLYDSLAAGTCLWSNDDSSCASDADLAVTLTDGLFSENLGDTGAGYAAIPDSVFADDASVFLEVEVEGEVLSPRKQIGAAAYAMNADTLDGINSTSFFVQNGNSLGAAAVLGTNDGFGLELETGGTTRLTLGTSGAITVPLAGSFVFDDDATDGLDDDMTLEVAASLAYPGFDVTVMHPSFGLLELVDPVNSAPGIALHGDLPAYAINVDNPGGAGTAFFPMSFFREGASSSPFFSMQTYPDDDGWAIYGPSVADPGVIQILEAGTVNAGAYAARSDASAIPILCASTRVEETAANLVQESCFMADGSLDLGLALAGTDTTVAQGGIERSSGSDETFAFANQGAGVLSLTADGTVDVSGHAAIGADALIDDGGLLYPGSTFSNTLNVSERSTDASVDYVEGTTNYLLYDPSADASGIWAIALDSEAATEATNAEDVGTLSAGYFNATHNGTGDITSWMSGIEAYVYTTATGGSSISNIGGYFSVTAQDPRATGTEDNYGVWSAVHRTGATGGTINTYGMYVDNDGVDAAGAGTSTLYGLFLESMTGADTNYSIYSAGGQSYHAGNFGIGATTPDADLDIEAAEDTERVRLTDSSNADSVGLYVGDGTAGLDGTLSAQAGSLFLDEDGKLWVNMDGATNWDQVATTAGGGTDLDGVYDNDSDKKMAVDNASGLEFESTTAGNVFVDLQSSGDFVIQSVGTAFATFNDSGNVSFENSLTVGSSSADVVLFNADVDSHFLPDDDDTYDLGADAQRWRDLYLGAATLHVGSLIGDEGTLSYDSTPNDFNFANGGATRMTIQSDGDVGIGDSMTSPTAQLHIKQTAAEDALRVDDEAAGTTYFVVDDGGNVGIGVTSGPSSTLHVVGDTRIGATDYVTMAQDGGGFYVEQIGSSDALRPIRLQSRNAATQYSQFFVDPVNGFQFLINATGANNNVGIADSTPDNLLDILSGSDAALALTSTGTDTDPLIKFELADGTPTFTLGVDDSDSDKFKISTTALGTSDRLVIDSSGFVGIGTSTPDAAFDVEAAVDANGANVLFEANDSGVSGSYFRIADGTEADTHFVPYIMTKGIGTGAADRAGLIIDAQPGEDGSDDVAVIVDAHLSGAALTSAHLFEVRNDATPLLRVAANGNLVSFGSVGIGTGTPGASLDVDPANVVGGGTSEQPSILGSNQVIALADGTTRANQRQFKFLAPTLNGVAGGGTETVTDAATFYVSDAPSGSDITFTNGPYALWVDAGTARFDGDAIVGGSTSITETLANAGFSIGGDDLFVAGTAGVEGNVYTDGSFIAGATLTLADSGITESGAFTFTSQLAAGGTTSSAYNLVTSNDLGSADEVLQIGDSTGTFATVLGNGNVGIGEVDPATILHVSGTQARVTIEDTGKGTGPAVLGHDSGMLFLENNGIRVISINDSGGSTGFGDQSPNAIVEVDQAGGSVDPFLISSNNGVDGDLFNVQDGGAVGVGDVSPDARFDIDDGAATGTIVGVLSNAGTQAGSLIGLSLDFDSSLAGAANLDFTGVRLLTPNLTQSTADTTDYLGYDLAAGAITQDTLAGTINWTGARIAMPVQVQTTGIVNTSGLTVTDNGSSNSGVKRGLFVDFSGIQSGGTLVGLDVDSITTGGGNGLGVRIGSGFDTDLQFVNAAAVIRVPNAGTLDFQDASENSLMLLTDAGSTSTLDVNGSIRAGTPGTDGQFRLYSEQGATDYEVAFNPHAAMTQATAYTLPADDGGSGQLLTTDGSGALSWSTAASGDITAVGSMTSGDAFADSTADDDWLGLGASAGRIEFDDQATDEVNILGANVGIGTSTPGSTIDATSPATLTTAYQLLADSVTDGTGLELSLDSLNEGYGLLVTSTADADYGSDLAGFQQFAVSTGTATMDGNVERIVQNLDSSTTGTLTVSGNAMRIQRAVNANSGTTLDATGAVMRISDQTGAGTGTLNSSSDVLSLTQFITTNSGDALGILHQGTGIGAHITMSTVSAPASGSVGNQALVLDTNETQSNDDMFIIRSDADGTPDTEFIFEADGDAVADGSFTGGGADYAEYYRVSDQGIEAGDVVCLDQENPGDVTRCSASAPVPTGVISTKPGFLANGQGRDVAADPSFKPVGLMGQVPTKVSLENGDIAVGDPVVASVTAPGRAMKAVEAGQIVGYALEPHTSQSPDAEILVYVRPGYHAALSSQTAAGTDNRASEIPSSGLTALNMSGNIYMAGNGILDVGAIEGIGARWSVDADGKFATQASYDVVIKSYQDEDVTVHAVLGREHKVTLDGTATLENGVATVAFETVDPLFNDITSTTADIRVSVTPNGPAYLYVVSKDHNGFTVQQLNGSDSGITFDWFVSAYRKDYEPEVIEVVEVTEEMPVEESVPTEGPVPEPVVEEPAPIQETAPVTDPAPTEPASTDSPLVEEPAPEPPPTDETPT